jgi:nucleotide-binding universal stress UspA family protein
MASAAVITPAKVKNIVFATDFSKHSNLALPHAAGIARHYNAALRIIHVFDPLAESESRAAAELQSTAAYQCQCLEGIPFVVQLEVGDALDVLMRRVERGDIDLIVLGTHGRVGLPKLLRGSIAEKIIRNAHRPVMTVGPGVESPATAAIRCILYATDFSTASQDALPHALSIAKEYDAELILLHVLIPSKPPRTNPSEAAVTEWMSCLEQTLPNGTPLKQPPKVLIECGRAADTIVRVAKQQHADLIVMGVHQGGFLRASTHLPWTITHHVLCHAPCPLLTIREKPALNKEPYRPTLHRLGLPAA